MGIVEKTIYITYYIFIQKTYLLSALIYNLKSYPLFPISSAIWRSMSASCSRIEAVISVESVGRGRSTSTKEFPTWRTQPLHLSRPLEKKPLDLKNSQSEHCLLSIHLMQTHPSSFVLLCLPHLVHRVHLEADSTKFRINTRFSENGQV